MADGILTRMETPEEYNTHYPINGNEFAGLTERADQFRVEVYGKLNGKQRSQMGQFFTPPPVACFMASLFGEIPGKVRLLDAGAGAGALTAAFVEEMLQRSSQPSEISVIAYEQEPLLAEYLYSIHLACQQDCRSQAVKFDSVVVAEDFIHAGTEMLCMGLFPVARHSFNRIILNPPYKKISSNSIHRRLLSSVGIETSNLYTAFLAIAVELLEPGGELVAITPRSFCNGPYFKAFRKLFLGSMALRRIHIFDSREEAFKGDEILQENIIFHAVKTAAKEKVLLSTSHGPSGDGMTLREVEYNQVVRPDDPDQIIHLATSEMDSFVQERIDQFRCSLTELGIGVSTGRVVDFRAREFLRDLPEEGSAPLIYPTHFADGYIRWPKLGGRKPNAIAISEQTASLFLPSGDYVLVRRFSAKEEPRRVVAALFDSSQIPSQVVGFENHLNVYHCNYAGLPRDIAKGLAVFLNSTLVDSYFRQFNGHTQVNATDLRKLQYPSREMLAALGRYAEEEEEFPSQHKIDTLLEQEIQQMAEIQSTDPVSAKQKIEQAISILESLGFPRGQLNDRSAYTLLALLDLRPATDWPEAKAPLIGITPIMDFCRDQYGRQYAPNTRETFRRQTMHQFVQAGLAIPNPDDPGRPVNSPKYCYQIEPNALALCLTFDSPQWGISLQAYLDTAESLKQRYARAREMKMIPVTLAEGQELYLTPGDHSRLVKAILDEFAPRFVPGGHVLYVGDTGGKWRYFDEEAMRTLGVVVGIHGKMPDVVIHHIEKGWLVLIEAVTSHGPVDPKRREELSVLFQSSSAGLVYVTAFLSRSDMAKYVGEISWETEVWVLEASTHLIHFNGERFLGPYE